MSSKIFFSIFATTLAATLFANVWLAWPGSALSYLLFSFAFSALLIIGITRRPSVGYLLLSVVLWIGFWLKLTLHMIYGTINEASKWVEPIGHFDFSIAAWDDVALVSSVGALAVLCAGLFWRRRIDNYSWQIGENIVWYTPGMRILGWVIVLAATALVVVLNEVFHIFHAGLRPALDMPWPLQGLFAWSVSVGIVLGAMILIHLDIRANRPLWLSIALFIAVSSALSITIFSRGTLVLHSLPFLVALILFRGHIPWLNRRRLMAIMAMFVCGTLLIVSVSEQRRANQLPQYAEESGGKITATDVASLLRRLSVHRWTGLEGVMAVSAYPGKGKDLMIFAAKERRGKDHVDLYTGDVSQSGFQDTSKYHYATFPGVFAFFYYSGSLLIMFVGTVILTTVVIAVEHAIRQVTQNPILAAQVGSYAVMVLAVQLGAGGLIQPASVLAFTVAVALTLGLLVRHRMPPLRVSLGPLR
ncbi:MAG: hypothetical protein ACOY5S_08345 [Pseudomonadota bacterium]